MNKIMSVGSRPFHHVAIRVIDLDACTTFYHVGLGLPILRRQHDAHDVPRSVWLELGDGGILMLERSTVRNRAPSGWYLFALRIQQNERRQVEDALQAQGISITGRTAYTLYIEDPEGNRIGLSHWPEPSS